ncbi:FMN-dependent NADH-azoreductase [Chelatococcus sp. SYSU_G07232]|uniref:FMN dependent NADH:quinone oxidoreductase n=1 Tax=Chelatococcus albus TaxID=3047466 RepID=A0ABT7AJT0_9HYPH|nr:FMN-dependent NADH-azoreductase [Chelatococcus sp. SYSU_G07232]MDJ1158846.1 FMN-dependent NADH-azoreductase [Chelatococcus sp. SYSU_G07232]
MQLLHIDSSILGDGSISRSLSAAVVAEWRRQAPDVAVTYRDLAAEPIAHLSSAHFAARATEAAKRSAEQQAEIDASDRALAEFLAADVVVIGAPMYNFSIPSQLKAWIDRLAVAGKTFRYTEKGPEGLAGGKKVIVVSSRGGVYSAGSPLEAIDHQERYLRSIFGFFGISDVEFVRAEGVNLSPEHKEQAISAARRSIAENAAWAA